jgi:hypothetical protein
VSQSVSQSSEITDLSYRGPIVFSQLGPRTSYRTSHIDRETKETNPTKAWIMDVTRTRVSGID